MSDQYYCFYPGDYQRDTSGLTLTEHGAYRVLLDAYYMEGSIPKEKERLYRICRAMTDEEKGAVGYVVGRYFKDSGNGHLSNKKADEEIARRNNFLIEQRRKSELGVKARQEKRNEPTGQPTGQPTGSGRVNQLGPYENSQQNLDDINNQLKLNKHNQQEPTGQPTGQPGGEPPHPHPHNIPPKSPKPEKTDKLFESFWLNYPKKEAKGRALKAWSKIKNKQEVIEQIKKVLPVQKESKDWTKEGGQFIPLPATYLNDRRWEDEIE